MLVVKCSDIDRILKDFGSFEKTKYVSELQRDNYEKNDPASKEVRLVVKAGFVPDRPLVIRFKNETDVTAESWFRANIRQTTHSPDGMM